MRKNRAGGAAYPRREVIRTAYESLALKYREAIDDLEKITGKRIDVLHIVGGGCQNLLLNRMTANAIGRKVVTGPAEGTAMGNILIQAMGEGIKDVAQLREVVRASVDTGEYLPQDKQAWDEGLCALLQGDQMLKLALRASELTPEKAVQEKPLALAFVGTAYLTCMCGSMCAQAGLIRICCTERP